VCLSRSFAAATKASVGDVESYLGVMESAYPDGLVLVASVGDGEGASQLAGCVCLSFDESTRDDFPPPLVPDPGSAYLSNIAVAPKQRRKGVARALMAAAEEASRARGMAGVQLHVYLDNAGAIELYEDLGYVELRKEGMLALLRGKGQRALLAKELS